MPKAETKITTCPPPLTSNKKRSQQPPAATIVVGCDAIMAAYDGFKNGRRGGYEGLVLTIEEHAEAIAPLAANSVAEMKAKAAVVQELAKVGCAMYAVRILAQSLATDVLARGAA